MTAKIHLIPKGAALALCHSTRRDAGRLAVKTRKEFEEVEPEGRCAKCAKILARIPGKRLLCAAAVVALAGIATAKAETYSDNDMNVIGASAYVCGMQRMKAIMHKSVDPMTKQGDEVCATIQLRAKYHPEEWQWLYQQDNSSGSTEDQVLRR